MITESMYDYHNHKVSRTLDTGDRKIKQPSIAEILQRQSAAQLAKIDDFSKNDQKDIKSKAFKDFLQSNGYALRDNIISYNQYIRWLNNRDKEKIKKYLNEFRSKKPSDGISPALSVPAPTQVIPTGVKPSKVTSTTDAVHSKLREEKVEHSTLPSIDEWDTDRSFHKATRKLLGPFYQKWKEKLDESPSEEITPLSDAIEYLQQKKRYFSHEMMLQYLDFAIAQGGLQSGYRTTRALGLTHGKRDQGKVQHDFVFTRQLPSEKTSNTLGKGQVGSQANAMIVLSPTMFGDSDQITFFKTTDGEPATSSIPQSAKKGDHIQTMSDTIAGSSDPILCANQEQGVQGSVALKHIAGIILKAEPKDDLEEKKSKFITHLQQTTASSLLPPPSVRKKIKKLDPKKRQSEYDRWKEGKEEGKKTLYQILEEGLNSELKDPAKRRTVESIIHVLAITTQRSDVIEKIGL